MAGSATDPPSFLRRRPVETGAAVALCVLGGLVSAESLAHDVGWSAEGPGAGYFPFRVGVLLCGAGIALIVRSLGAADASFATSRDLRRTWSVFWPTAALRKGQRGRGRERRRGARHEVFIASDQRSRIHDVMRIPGSQDAPHELPAYRH